MLRAIVVDDSSIALRTTSLALEASREVVVVGRFTNAADALTAMPHLDIEAAFLDIEMPRISGLELAEQIANIDETIGVVFTTAHEKYALDAFRVYAVDYLTKPLSIDRLTVTIQRLQRHRITKGPIAQQPSCRVLCLGEFAVYGPTAAVPLHWRTSKTQELFAYLVMHLNRSLSKWRIIEDLWGGKAPEKQEKLLHTTLYYLRQGLSKAGITYELRHQNGCYHLALPGAYLDFMEFDRVTCQTGFPAALPAQALQKACQIYSGEYLESQGYLWSLPLASRLAKAYQQATQALED